MSESVLIALVSALSGFIVAFLAEPVKTYFQNRAKLMNLRIALYKELAINYIVLDKLAPDDASQFKWGGNNPSYALRTECYKHALESEYSTFYQMKDANLINLMMGIGIIQIIEGFNYLRNLSDEQRSSAFPQFIEMYLNNSTNFKNMFASAFYHQRLDRKIITDFINKPTYESLMKRGKEYLASHASEESTN